VFFQTSIYNFEFYKGAGTSFLSILLLWQPATLSFYRSNLQILCVFDIG